MKKLLPLFTAFAILVLTFVGFGVANARINNPPPSSGASLTDANTWTQLQTFGAGFITLTSTSTAQNLQVKNIFASSTVIADGIVDFTGLATLRGGFMAAGNASSTAGRLNVQQLLASTTAIVDGQVVLSAVSGNTGIGSTTPQAKLSVSGSITNTPVSLTDGTTITIDWSQGNVFYVTLGGSRTLAFTNASTTVGQSIRVYVTQGAAGSNTLSYPGMVHFKGGAPTLSTGVGETDVLNFSTATSADSIHGTYAIN